MHIPTFIKAKTFGLWISSYNNVNHVQILLWTTRLLHMYNCDNDKLKTYVKYLLLIVDETQIVAFIIEKYLFFEILFNDYIQTSRNLIFEI